MPQKISVPAGQRGASTARGARAGDEHAFVAQLLERYEAGETVKALAAEFGMHHRTIKKRLEAAGATIRIRERKLTDADVDEIVQLYMAGLSTQQVGDRYGVSHNTVRRHLGYRGVSMRPMGRPVRKPN